MLEPIAAAATSVRSEGMGARDSHRPAPAGAAETCDERSALTTATMKTRTDSPLRGKDGDRMAAPCGTMEAVGSGLWLGGGAPAPGFRALAVNGALQEFFLP